MYSRTSSILAKPPRWLSPERTVSSPCCRRETAFWTPAMGTTWSVSPCHHRTGTLTSANRKPQSRPNSQAATVKGVDHVVDEDRLDFRIGQHPSVVLGPPAGVEPVGVVRERDQGCQ